MQSKKENLTRVEIGIDLENHMTDKEYIEKFIKYLGMIVYKDKIITTDEIKDLDITFEYTTDVYTDDDIASINSKSMSLASGLPIKILSDQYIEKYIGELDIDRYYILRNSKGEEALLRSKIEKCKPPRHYDSLSIYETYEIEIIYPFSKQYKLSFDEQIFIKNKENGKKGLYDVVNKFNIPVEFDFLKKGKGDYWNVSKGTKKGRLSHIPAFNIPCEYDDIIENKESVIEYNNIRYTYYWDNVLTLVRNENKFGAFCSLLVTDKVYKNIDEVEEVCYYKKEKIESIFDKVELFDIDNRHHVGEFAEIILKVWNNGKCGLYKVFAHEFKLPIIFDEILKGGNLIDEEFTGSGISQCIDQNRNSLNYCYYGIIDGSEYVYVRYGDDEEKLFKIKIETKEVKINPNITDEKVKCLLNKKPINL